MPQDHLYILNNSNEVLSSIVCHEALVKESNPKMAKNSVLKEHNKTFLNWFKDTIFGDDNASKTLRRLVDGPKRNVKSWLGYDINKHLISTKSQATRVQCKTMRLVLGLNPNTLQLYMMTIFAQRLCLTLESLKKFRRLIMLNSLCVFSSVSELIAILVCESMISYLLW